MRDDRLLLIDMVEHAREVRRAMASLTRESFDKDFMLRMGIAHSLQVIGEASRLVSHAARQQYPHMPWKQIVGMRHRLVHEYFQIDFDLVWKSASVSIPELLEILEPEIGPLIDSHSPDKKT